VNSSATGRADCGPASGERVRVVEVGPRDGLQNEKQYLRAQVKIELIERLATCGLPVVEATSFVSKRWIPQLADADTVLSKFRRREGVAYPVLVPNVAGLERALEVGAHEIAIFTSPSDAFNRKNINCDTDESLARLAPVVAGALEHGLPVRGYVSCALGCPYQGDMPVADVVRVSRRLVDMGCGEIAVSDTIGSGTARAVREVLRAVAAEVPLPRIAVHFHDTRGQALPNVYVSLEEGIRIVDGSVAGLGGCPYASGAAGNLATEDLVFMLHGLGLETGIDLPALIETARWISAELGRAPASKLARAGLPKRLG